jgi:hypothetical protein
MGAVRSYVDKIGFTHGRVPFRDESNPTLDIFANDGSQRVGGRVHAIVRFSSWVKQHASTNA